jgi:hypothetical protein
VDGKLVETVDAAQLLGDEPPYARTGQVGALQPKVKQ